MKLTSSWRAIGDPAPRRAMPIQVPSGQLHDVWWVDVPMARVAALWLDGTLWLGGSGAWVVRERVETLQAALERPPVPGADGVASWFHLVPEPGCRYIVVDGAILGPEAPPADLAALPVPPASGWLARTMGWAPSPDAAALAIDVAAEPQLAGLIDWIERLRARGDLSWSGNEAGRGLLHTFSIAREPGQRVEDALAAYARQDARVTAEIEPSAQNWLDREETPSAGLLVEGHPVRGYLAFVPLDAVAEHVNARFGTEWLDPSTPNARPAYISAAGGDWVVAQVRSLVDEAAAISVSSAPEAEDSVTMCHLIGGIDRRSGEVVGFVLTRAWT